MFQCNKNHCMRANYYSFSDSMDRSNVLNKIWVLLAFYWILEGVCQHRVQHMYCEPAALKSVFLIQIEMNISLQDLVSLDRSKILLLTHRPLKYPMGYYIIFKQNKKKLHKWSSIVLSENNIWFTLPTLF